MRLRRLFRTITVAALSACLAGPAVAAVPLSASIQGTLLTSGAPVVDGVYELSFRLYKDEAGGEALWTEKAVPVAVKGGIFQAILGAKTPLDPKLLAGLQTAWIGIQVEAEPELPRKSLQSVPFSLRAAMAEGLDCSGCVALTHLDPKILEPYAQKAQLAKVAFSGKFTDLEGGPDLTGYAKTTALAKVATTGSFGDLQGVPDLTAYAKKAELHKVAATGQYGDLLGAPDLGVYAKTANLKDVALTGSYADLTDKPVMAKLGASCGTGLVVKGIKADGSYECVAAMDPNALPADGLDEISGGLLTNQFTDTTSGPASPIAIPDNNPDGAVHVLDVPDFGIAQAVELTLDLANSDVSQLTVTVTDPAGATLVLWDKTAGTGKTIQATFPKPQKLVSGDLAPWVGKNPKGKWTLKITDTGFLNNDKDGELKAWSVRVKNVSSKKVAATGGLQFYAGDTAPTACNSAQIGVSYVNVKDNSMLPRLQVA